MTNTLIQIQEMTIARMMEARTSAKRLRKSHVAAFRAYRKHASKMGYTDQQIDQQVKDIKDMYELEMNAED